MPYRKKRERERGNNHPTNYVMSMKRIKKREKNFGIVSYQLG
jgi:hypothetical protein